MAIEDRLRKLQDATRWDIHEPQPRAFPTVVARPAPRMRPWAIGLTTVATVAVAAVVIVGAVSLRGTANNGPVIPAGPTSSETPTPVPTETPTPAPTETTTPTPPPPAAPTAADTKTIVITSTGLEFLDASGKTITTSSYFNDKDDSMLGLVSQALGTKPKGTADTMDYGTTYDWSGFTLVVTHRHTWPNGFVSRALNSVGATKSTVRGVNIEAIGGTSIDDGGQQVAAVKGAKYVDSAYKLDIQPATAEELDPQSDGSLGTLYVYVALLGNRNSPVINIYAPGNEYFH